MEFKYFVHSGLLSKVLLFHIPDDVSQVPVSLQYIKPVADRANPKMGIGMLAFSPDNCFLATKNGEFLLPYIRGQTCSLCGVFSEKEQGQQLVSYLALWEDSWPHLKSARCYANVSLQGELSPCLLVHVKYCELPKLLIGAFPQSWLCI